MITQQITRAIQGLLDRPTHGVCDTLHTVGRVWGSGVIFHRYILWITELNTCGHGTWLSPRALGHRWKQTQVVQGSSVLGTTRLTANWSSSSRLEANPLFLVRLTSHWAARRWMTGRRWANVLPGVPGCCSLCYVCQPCHVAVCSVRWGGHAVELEHSPVHQ